MLEEVIEFAIGDASVEIEDGAYNHFQLEEMVEITRLMTTAKSFLVLTYANSTKDLLAVINDNLALLPGGKDWKFGRRNK